MSLVPALTLVSLAASTLTVPLSRSPSRSSSASRSLDHRGAAEEVWDAAVSLIDASIECPWDCSSWILSVASCTLTGVLSLDLENGIECVCKRITDDWDTCVACIQERDEEDEEAAEGYAAEADLLYGCCADWGVDGFTSSVASSSTSTATTAATTTTSVEATTTSTLTAVLSTSALSSAAAAVWAGASASEHSYSSWDRGAGTSSSATTASVSASSTTAVAVTAAATSLPTASPSSATSPASSASPNSANVAANSTEANSTTSSSTSGGRHIAAVSVWLTVMAIGSMLWA